MNDLTKQADVVRFMKQANSESDWNARCDDVKKANDGEYPAFWFSAIVLSGVARDTQVRWMMRITG